MKFRKLPERRKSRTSNYDSCAAFGCRSTEIVSYNVSFHCFPGSNEYISVKNEFGKVEYIDRLKAWKTVLKISRTISPRMRVCSLHLKKTDFIAQCVASQKRYLKSNAIPSCSLKPAVSQAQLERLRQNNNVPSKKFKDQVVKVEPVPTTGQWQNFVIKKVFQDHENGELHFMRAASTTIDQQNASLEDKQFKDQVVKIEPVPTAGQWQNFVIKKAIQDHESGELHFMTDDSTTIDQQNSSLEDDAVNEESDFMIDGLLFKAQQYNKNNEEIDPTTILTHESFENTVSAHLDDNVNGGFDFMIDDLLFKANQHNTQYEEIIPTAGFDFESPVNITSDTFQSSIHENLSSQVKEALFKVTHYIKNEERHLIAMPTIFENSENVASAVNQDCINEELCSGMNNVNIKEDQCDVNNTEINQTIVPTDENFINARPLKLLKDIAIQVDLINEEDIYDGTKSYFCDNIKTDNELNIATGIDNFDIFNEIEEMVSSSKGNKYNNNLKMSSRQQIIMTFVRLKHKLSYSFLAILFDCSSRCCQEVFRNTLQVLSLSLIKYYSSDPDSRYLRMFARIFDP